MHVSIGLPVYNESEGIESVITEISLFLEQYKNENKIDANILVVDDGSTDYTPEILKKLKKTISSLIVVTHKKNQGYRRAVQSCIENFKGEYIVIMDSDGQFSIKDLPKFLEKVNEGYSLVLGNKIVRNDPKIRILLGKGYNFLFGIFFGIKLNEVDCGYRLLTKEFASKIHLGSGNLPIGPEIAVTALSLNYKIVEIPVSHYERKGGKTVFPLSKLPLVVFLSFKELIKLKIKSKKIQRLE